MKAFKLPVSTRTAPRQRFNVHSGFKSAKVLSMTAVDVFNAVEVVIWCGIGLEFLRRGFVTGVISRRLASIAGVTFLLFGLSDVVELQTGAFWRPWWLLVWKGICIALFVWLWISRRSPGRFKSPAEADQN